MAVAVDTIVNSTGLDMTDVTSLTIPLTIANNSNRAVYVAVGAWDSIAADCQVSSISWNGSTSGWQEVVNRISVDNNRSLIRRLLNPAAVSSNIVITMGGTCSEVGAVVYSLHGVHQTTPEGTPQQADGTGTTPTITVAGATDDLIIDVLYYNRSSALTAGAGQTGVTVTVIAGGSFLGSSREAGATSVVMDWSASADFWTQVGVAVKAAAAGGATAHPQFYARRRR
jgi:hypothetical protein